MDHGHEVRPEASAIAKLPSDYVKHCWFDTITHNPRALRYLIDTVGVSQIVLGSDYPADMGEPWPVDWIEGCADLSSNEKTAILSGNGTRLFNLAAAGPKIAAVA
jgi:aminocarboxymuconate-semialdehyde decarboxylase